MLAVYAYFAVAPDNYNLPRPLDLRDRPTFVTDLKLRLAGAGLRSPRSRGSSGLGDGSLGPGGVVEPTLDENRDRPHGGERSHHQ